MRGNKLNRILKGYYVPVGAEWLDKVSQEHPRIAEKLATAINRSASNAADNFVCWSVDYPPPSDLVYKTLSSGHMAAFASPTEEKENKNV